MDANDRALLYRAPGMDLTSPTGATEVLGRSRRDSRHRQSITAGDRRDGRPANGASPLKQGLRQLAISYGAGGATYRSDCCWALRRRS